MMCVEGVERVVRSGRARDLTPPYGARRHAASEPGENRQGVTSPVQLPSSGFASPATLPPPGLGAFNLEGRGLMSPPMVGGGATPVKHVPVAAGGPTPSGGVPSPVFPQQGLMSPAFPVPGQQVQEALMHTVQQQSQQVSQMMSLVEALVREKTQGAPAAKSESSGLSLSSDKGMDGNPKAEHDVPKLPSIDASRMNKGRR